MAEFEKAQKIDESAALSDDELEAVAGGISLSSEARESIKNIGKESLENVSKVTEAFREAAAEPSVKESIAHSVTASVGLAAISPDKFF